MDITDAGHAFVEGCVVRIDCEAGATGEMVCAIVYIEDEERQAKSTEIIWQVTFVDRLLNLCCASRNRTQSTDVDDHQPHVLPAVVVPIQEFAARRVWYMSF